jgi:hypothetical protein
MKLPTGARKCAFQYTKKIWSQKYKRHFLEPTRVCGVVVATVKNGKMTTTKDFGSAITQYRCKKHEEVKSEIYTT